MEVKTVMQCLENPKDCFEFHKTAVPRYGILKALFGPSKLEEIGFGKVKPGMQIHGHRDDKKVWLEGDTPIFLRDGKLRPVRRYWSNEISNPVAKEYFSEIGIPIPQPLDEPIMIHLLTTTIPEIKESLEKMDSMKPII